MLIRFKKIIIFILVCSFIFSSFIFNNSNIYSYANEEYEWNYGIVEDEPFENSTELFVDEDKTTLTIDHKKKEIRLDRESFRNSISFIDEDNSPIAYSVMTENGIKQYAYDGFEMVEIGFLEIEVENPLAMATKQSSPDIIIAHNPALNEDVGGGNQDERSDYKIEYYGFDGFEMISVPFLEIAGLKEVRAMGFLKDEITAVLTDEALNVYGFDGDSMVEIPILKIDGIENPLDFAADGEYNISLLTENEIKQFAFAGDGLVEIPGLSILLNTINDIGKPRFIASVEGRVTLIDEYKVCTFLQGADEMHYVQALSVTEGLTNPMGLSIHRNSHDLIILDQLEENEAIIRYYMFDGTSLIEIPELSLELKDIILGIGGKYDLKGVLVSKPLKVEKNYIDLLQVGIYSYLEEDTSIKLFVSNGYEAEIDADENVWKPIWNLERKEGEHEPILYKNHGKNFLENWKAYEGGIKELYPIGLNTGLGIDTNPKLEDYEVIEGDDGKLYLKPKKEDEKTKWFKFEIPMEDIDLNKDSYVKFKMEFYSKEGKKTPKVFVPSIRNKIDGIEDDTAIRILARRKPLIPIIDDIDPEVPSDDDLPNQPKDDKFPEFPKPIAKEGWVYTTTPTIKWHIPILDYRGTDEEGNKVDDTYQIAYQLVLMAITKDGYKPAFVTDKITTSASGPIEIVRELMIPTSDAPQVEGPLYASGSYRFAAFVRIWDPEDNPSEFSTGKMFNVLAFERPRIEKIESTPSGLMNKPTMVQKDMTVDKLLRAKAGTAITFLVDAVGPVENDLESDDDISIFYYTDTENKNFVMDKGIKKSLYNMGSDVNRISIISWTPAPVTKNVEGSIAKTYLYGDSSIGGRTIFAIPKYAEGIAEINSTVYKDWEVFLDGRD